MAKLGLVNYDFSSDDSDTESKGAAAAPIVKSPSMVVVAAPYIDTKVS